MDGGADRMHGRRLREGMCSAAPGDASASLHTTSAPNPDRLQLADHLSELVEAESARVLARCGLAEVAARIKLHQVGDVCFEEGREWILCLLAGRPGQVCCTAIRKRMLLPCMLVFLDRSAAQVRDPRVNTPLTPHRPGPVGMAPTRRPCPRRRACRCRPWLTRCGSSLAACPRQTCCQSSSSSR